MPSEVASTPLAQKPPAAGLAAWAQRFRPALWRYLRVLGADAATADDLVQEAFVVALQRPAFDAAHAGAVFTFLRTAARQLWLRHTAGRRNDRELAEADAVWDARCGGGPGDDYVEALRACVQRLPERSRALLTATYAHGDGRAATGSRFGLGGDGVKSALRRLRKFLHDCIRKRLQSTP